MLTQWNCPNCKKAFFADEPICPSCRGAVNSHAVAQMMYLFNISDDEAQLAIAVQDGEYPERYKQIRDCLGISECQMFIGVIVAANRGDYAGDGIPAWSGTIGDALEQEECYKCEATFTPDPERTGQHLCPACEDEEHDHYHRRDDAAYPVGAVGSC